ncbi:uncharacterized protein MKZ38_001983 [Zalerion maritima]|uniref:Uncharacterized protein n=1 Tax=Zalerion maritima TaxID=339359 RepID=A0AAD5RQ94_9PEZI|nr:uncharacterized protein MKZ38_001983 [Zalerion maritima]
MMSASSHSTRPTPSPNHGPVTDDEATHPKGHCRYILLNAPIKGERCGCTGFIHNKNLPGLSCDCGHYAVYHVSSTESAGAPPHQSLEATEMEELKRRLERLERAQLEQEQQRVAEELEAEDHSRSFLGRLGELEQLIENNKEEQGAEVLRAFSNISNAWYHLEQLKMRMEETFLRFDTRFGHTDSRVGSLDTSVTTLTNRQRMLDEEQLELVERIDQLEAAEKEEDEEDEPTTPNEERQPVVSQLRGRWRRRMSASDSISSGVTVDLTTSRRRSSTTRPAPIEVPPPRPLPFRFPGSQAWTVHISLLPQADQGMPFEKDTNAYKRCLSRGLHQMVAVQGPDKESFVTAVEKAFGSLLKGRPWMPLQAMLCDVQQLQGLPMVRSLDKNLINQPYDLEFLKEHCAVCDRNGKIDSLYIAMRGHTLSWQVIKQSPVFLDGLEACWEHDPKLDDNGGYRESAGAILMAGMPPSVSTPTSTTSTSTMVAPMGAANNELKRNLSQISRTSSFGSPVVVCEADGSRTKMARTRMALVQGKS